MGKYHQKCISYLSKLCQEIPERPLGSQGNREATRFFSREIRKYGWERELQEFSALDWVDGGAILKVEDTRFEVHVSPYSLGHQGEGILVAASTLEQLHQLDMKGKIVMLHGDIAREQLMPKNFPFYNPEGHQRIIATLEQGQPTAILCATGRNSALAGGVYPFPLIEDGDFNIPSVYMTAEEGDRLLPYIGVKVFLESSSLRVPGKGYNVIARKGKDTGERIVVTAHIDAKKGTPGAIDNATGVAILLLLADLLSDYDRDPLLEIVAFNGEDYYAASGQVLYLENNIKRYEQVLVNINIDGAGYKESKTAYSFYNLPENVEKEAKTLISQHPHIKVGSQWFQGDHSIFIQNGIPAIAVSSDWFIENMDDQDITHTPKDNLTVVNIERVVDIAMLLSAFLK